MKFVCDKCHTRYSISDEKVKGKVLKIRCKTCGNIIVVREQGAESAAVVAAEGRGPAPRTEVELPRAAAGGGGSGGAGRPIAAGRAEVEWFVAIKGKQHGPMKKEQLEQLFREARIHPRSYCWHEDLPAWTRMKDLPDFAAVIAQGQSAPAVGQPPPPPPDDEGAEVVSLDAHRRERAATSPVPDTTPAHNDPFAAVAGAPAAGVDSAPRESTRVFIMNAGLHNRSKKHKTYAVVASIVFATIVGLGALDYAGIVRIPLLGDATLALAAKLGDENAAEKKQRRDIRAAWEDGENVDPEAQCKFLGICPQNDAAGQKRRARKPGDSGELGDEFFQTGGPGESGVVGRGDVGPDGKPLDLTASNASDAEKIKGMLSGGRDGPLKVEAKIKTGSEIAVGGGGGPDPAQLQKVVTQNMGAVQECIERAAKQGSTASGKQKLLLLIQPNGRVKAARIAHGPTNASPVGECITKAGKKWKFPPFADAEPFELEIPLVLTTNL